jgi:hypothetical protein
LHDSMGSHQCDEFGPLGLDRDIHNMSDHAETSLRQILRRAQVFAHCSCHATCYCLIGANGKFAQS